MTLTQYKKRDMAAEGCVPELLPAVTVPEPSVMKAGRSFCKPSSVDLGLGNSSSHTSVTPGLKRKHQDVP